MLGECFHTLLCQARTKMTFDLSQAGRMTAGACLHVVTCSNSDHLPRNTTPV